MISENWGKNMSDMGAKSIHSMIAWEEYEVEDFKLFSINCLLFGLSLIQIYLLISITCTL